MEKQKVQILDTNVIEPIRKFSKKCVKNSFKKFIKCGQRANEIKFQLDNKYGLKWHCIVGTHFGCNLDKIGEYHIIIKYGDYCVSIIKTQPKTI